MHAKEGDQSKVASMLRGFLDCHTMRFYDSFELEIARIHRGFGKDLPTYTEVRCQNGDISI